MIDPTIKSQPVYAPLRWDDAGTSHILAANRSGGERLRALLEARTAAQATAPCIVIDGSSDEVLYSRLRSELESGRMGLRLYLAGTEGFLWQAARIAREFGMERDEMQAELWGSRERRVYCTHCQAVTDGVRTNVFPCPACGRTLLVRDHFSRHLAAYMGVQVDAETPGVVPPVEALYP